MRIHFYLVLLLGRRSLALIIIAKLIITITRRANRQLISHQRSSRQTQSEHIRDCAVACVLQNKEKLIHSFTKKKLHNNRSNKDPEITLIVLQTKGKVK